LVNGSGDPVDVRSKNRNECWVTLMGKFLAKWEHWNEDITNQGFIKEAITGGYNISSVDIHDDHKALFSQARKKWYISKLLNEK